VDLSATPRRVLVVDDDVLTTELEQVALEAQGNEVEVANSVAEALRCMVKRSPFDVLLTDLHIEGPGDGLVVAAAGKALQPGMITHLMSGYPDIASGLKAIESAVDDIFVKPATAQTLRERVGHALARPSLGKVGRERLPALLREYRAALIEEWYVTVEADPSLATIALDKTGRLDHIAELLLNLAARMENPQSLRPGTAKLIAQSEAARLHGSVRREQGYGPIGILREAARLRETIGALIERHLMLIDLSFFLRDVLNLNVGLDAEIIESLAAWGLDG